MSKLFRRLRHWLAETYLPRYAYEMMEDERRRLESQLAAAKEQLRQQQSYIAGLQYAVRYGRCAPARGRQDEKKA